MKVKLLLERILIELCATKINVNIMAVGKNG